MKILVTGANGFVGSALLKEIYRRSQRGCDLIGLGTLRTAHTFGIQDANSVIVGDINARTNWEEALSNINVVVHAAARAHVLRDNAEDPLGAFRAVNVDGTVKLAERALQAGVHRFIFISSIGVNGSQTFGPAFTSDDAPNPIEPYAVSKFEAEVALRRIFTGSQTQLVIVRPPLVYGRRAPGNFGVLMRAVQRGWPLPLGAVHNQRSLVALDNLVDLIVTCISHSQAANQTFLVSDGQDLSTTELVRGMVQAAGVSARLLPVPVWALQAGASLLGKGDAVQRLCGNLQVDISKARSLLGWVPPLSVEEGLRRAMAI